MKIKIIYQTGNLKVGQEFEAVVSKSKSKASVFDEKEMPWTIYSPSFVILEEEKTEQSSNKISVRDLLGQDLKTLEFK